MRIRGGSWRLGTIQRREGGDGFLPVPEVGVVLDEETTFMVQHDTQNLRYLPEGLDARKQPPENMQG